MASITYTGNDGVSVEFVDPAGVQAAIAAAQTVPVEVIKDEIIENTDGTTETLEPVEVSESTEASTEI